MRRQAIFSMPLSFAIVLIAAIALSGPVPGPSRDVADGGPGPSPIDQGTVTPVEETTPVEGPALVEAAEPPAAIHGPPLAATEPTGPVPGPSVEPVASKPVPPDPPADSPVPVPDPADSVPVGRPTVVASAPGETIADVAARVFGTTELVDALIDVNADVEIEPDRPLPDGTLLRLP